jgi:predicted Holliday junction resolvase-like endonuclease
MLIRIGLIIAIVAGLAVAGINIAKVKDNIATLRTNLSNETQAKNDAQAAQAAAEKKQADAEKELASTKTELADTQDARDKAVAEADDLTKRAAKLSDDLAKAQQERNDAQDNLAAFNALGLTADQIKPMIAELKAVTQERDDLLVTNQVYTAKIAHLRNRLANYGDEEGTMVELPENLVGKVLVADPKWDFVVLNIGTKQGAVEDGVMLVNRNGRLVAKVQLRSVQPDRSIANVLPDWKLGDVMEGDEVIP